MNLGSRLLWCCLFSLAAATGCSNGTGGTGASGGAGGSGGTGGTASGGTGGSGGSGGSNDCGNGSIESSQGEDCDYLDLGGATCEDLGNYTGGTLSCTGSCRFDLSQCEGPVGCGDGFIEGGEDCDGANLGGANCQLAGDFTGGTLGCNLDCTFNTSACDPAPVCGNSLVEPGEDCDGINLAGRNCATVPGNYNSGTLNCAGCVYDTSGCTLDPCADVLTPCALPGAGCANQQLVVCAENTFGCLEETTTNCLLATNGDCDDSGPQPQCVSDDACVDECAILGALCAGDSVSSCELDAFGCKKQIVSDCTALPLGFCDDSSGSAVCDVAPDPCAGKTLCAGSSESSECEVGTTDLVTCAFDVDNCLVRARQDCAIPTGGFCDDGGATATCEVDLCFGKPLCPGSTELDECRTPTLLAECAFDGDNCLVETLTNCGTVVDGYCADRAGFFCAIAACGNDIIELDEQCDPPDGVFCDVDCTSLTGPVCGNGDVEFGEECEPPNTTTCDNDCQFSFPLGSTCTVGDDCASGTCLDESSSGWPGGVCSQSCSGTCPSGSECFDIGAMRCVPTCSSDANCNPGTSCIDVAGSTSPICLPNCHTGGDCPDTSVCNPWSGWCDATSGLAQTGETCATDGECESGLCFVEGSLGAGSFPGGYCSAYCSLSDDICPGDGACLVAGSTLAGECFDGCAGDPDCREAEGYSCQSLGGPVCYYGLAGANCAISVDITSASLPVQILGDFQQDGTGGPSCDAGTYTNAVFFHYQAPASGRFAITADNASSSGPYSRLAIYTGGCDATGTELTCEEASSAAITVNYDLVAGETYYFWFFTDGDSYSMIDPVIDIALAVPTLVSDTLPFIVPADTGSVVFDLVFSEPVDGVDTTNVTVDNGATLVRNAGVDGSSSYTFTLSGMANDTAYAITIASVTGSGSGLTFEPNPTTLFITQDAPAGPGQDCGTSVDLTGQTFPFQFTGSFDLDGGGGPSCDSTFNNALFFHYTPAADGSYEVTAVNNSSSGAYSRLAIFTGNCDATGTELSCDTINTDQIAVTADLTGGVTYYFWFYTDGDSYTMVDPSIDILVSRPTLVSTTLPAGVPAGTGSVDFDLVFSAGVDGVNTTNVTVDGGANLVLNAGVDGDTIFNFSLTGMVNDTLYTSTIAGVTASAGGAALDPDPTVITIMQRPVLPAGFECDTAIDLTAATFPHQEPGNFTVDGAGGPFCNGDAFYNAFYFRYDAPSAGNYLVTATKSSSLSTLAAATGGCGAAGVGVDCWGSSTDTMMLAVVMSAGETYYFEHSSQVDFDANIDPTITIEPCGSDVVGVTPLDGAIDVPNITPLTVEFPRAVRNYLGTITITGDGGSAFSFNLGTGTGDIAVGFSAGDTIMTLIPSSPFATSEQITVSWDTELAYSLCSDSVPVPAWTFTTSATGVVELWREGFVDAAAVTAWNPTDPNSCTGWVHSSDANIVADGGRDTYGGWDAFHDGTYAIVDSDVYGQGCWVLSEITSPIVDTSSYGTVLLSYDVGYRELGAQRLDVDVFDGAGWVPLTSYVITTSEHASFDVTAYANAAFQVRFLFDDNDEWDYYARIDNVVLQGL